MDLGYRGLRAAAAVTLREPFQAALVRATEVAAAGLQGVRRAKGPATPQRPSHP